MSHPPHGNALPRGAHHELPRVLGFTSVVGILVGTVIGSGIFVAPNRIAELVGSPQLILAVWVVGGVLSFFGALAFAELGAAFPQAGGMYVYLRESYGSMVAFLFGWALFFVIDSGAIATLSVAFSARYLTYFVPLSPFESKMVGLALIGVLVAVNILGVRYGAAVQNVLMFIKFGAIVAVSLAVFTFADGSVAHFVEPAPPGWSGALSSGLVGKFGAALVLSLWAYKGWEAVTFSSGEIRDPQRNLPLGLLGGTAVVIVLYIATNLAYLYVFPAGEIARSNRIAADAMNAAIGPVGASLIAGVILCSITGAANGNVLTAPRVFFAMARDGVFFRTFADLHPRLLTPHISILATGAWAAVLSVTGTFEQLATYVVFGQWIFFGLTVGAVMILRAKRPDLPRPYRTWGYPVTPVIFILAAFYISASTLVTQPLNAAAGLAIILAGVPAFLYLEPAQGGGPRLMPFWEILVVAVGLSMDAVAVSLAASASNRARGARAMFRLAFHFGLFQFLMPVIGWLIGSTVAPYIASFDHWLAFALLAFVGVRMIRAALGGVEEDLGRDPSRGATLLMLSVATSIDALAIGMTLAMIGDGIWIASVVIGIVTGSLSLLAVVLGTRVGRAAGTRMEIVGGVALIAIGVKLVIDHLW